MTYTQGDFIYDGYATPANVIEAFTAAGEGTGILSLNPGDSLVYVIEGTFVATVTIEESRGFGWQVIATYTTPTLGLTGADANGYFTLTVPGGRGTATQYRFNCIDFTSGEADCAIFQDPSVVHKITDRNGANVATFLDTGGGLEVNGSLTSRDLRTLNDLQIVGNLYVKQNLALGAIGSDQGLGALQFQGSDPQVSAAEAVLWQADGGLLIKAFGTATAKTALSIYQDGTADGLKFQTIDEDISLAAAGAKFVNLTNTIPSGAVILGVQANIDTLVVAGGTTVKVAIGLSGGDVDKYGKTSTLAKNQKITTIPDWEVLSIATQLAVCGVVTDGSALGDSDFSAGVVHVRVIYLQLSNLFSVA